MRLGLVRREPLGRRPGTAHATDQTIRLLDPSIIESMAALQPSKPGPHGSEAPKPSGGMSIFPLGGDVDAAALTCTVFNSHHFPHHHKTMMARRLSRRDCCP
jgi:hypothetical protein